jgi:DNA-binding CsgD family transcriptional regulator
VRAAIAAAVAPSERGALHRRAARLLAADGATPERLALHLVEVAPEHDAWVVATLRDAAAQALARGAPETAARFLRRALREPPPAAELPTVLLETGEAEAQTGDERAVAHLRAAIDAASDPLTHARAALVLAPLLGMAGRVGAGVDVALAALGQLDGADRAGAAAGRRDGGRSDAGADRAGAAAGRRDGEAELALRLEGELLSLARLDSEHRVLGVERLARSDPDALGDSPGAGMVLAMHANEELSQGASRAAALAYAERALAGGRLLGMPFMYAQAATTVMFCGRYAQAVVAWDDFLAHARRRGDLPALALAHVMRASAHWHAGALADALADAEVALHVAEARGLATVAAFARLFEVEAHVLRGELDDARAALAAAPDLKRQLLEGVLISARGRLRAAEGRWREALADMTTVGRLLEGWHTPNTAVAPWRAEAALAAATLGDGATARRLADEEVATAGRWGDPWLLGQALRAQALVGPSEERVARLRGAVDVLRPSEARLELARTLVELEAAECAGGNRGAARETLREALELAARCDAPALVERARDALVAAGARPRRPAATGPAALTPSERRVARLAAAGTSNRAIAQALFVTEKTVETHLASAYRKLAIGGRAQLPDALADRG